MKMSRLKFPFLLIAACTVGGIASHCQTFAVTIKASVTSVSRNEPFAVSTEVRNVGTRKETIDVWQCIYPPDWISDNRIVEVIYDSCLQNNMVKITLKPGESRKSHLYVRITSFESAKDKSVTFRLGHRIKLSGGEMKPPTITPPIWSNPFTIVMNQ
jgi:hypothetical protein